jgi:glutamyl-tRNA synthetase
MLSQDVVDSLFPPDLPEPDHWEHRYPPRDLPGGAKVTRFAPSPTGFLTIGGVFTATIDADVARQSGGIYLVRLEDTDQARVTEGAAEQFAEAFAYFSIAPDEDDQTGGYGPYEQSARSQTYLTYVRELLRQGRAYPCFATRQDLEEITARQRAAGALPGYYGKWAIWRDADPEQVAKRLAVGDPYVVRFRSPGVTGVRVSFTDAIRGELTLDDNRNDAVILKSSDTEPRLPTYHFAHAVDDHLMRVNLVIRGDEWISSVPLHLQLFDALGFGRVEYAHVAPLMKQEGGSRRKLSKRRDPEATVTFYIEQGYPAPAVQYYLRGLANGRLAEMPLAEALAAPIRLAECGTAGPLVDMVKLDDISADYVATLPGEQILAEVGAWARRSDPELAEVLEAERDLALRALDIDRVDVANPRKDLRKWADFRAVYGYFFPELFELVTDPADARFSRLNLDPDVVRDVAWAFADAYQPPAADIKPDREWFNQVRRLADALGFAPSQKVYKQDPAAYKGSIREASQVIRILLTGTPNSPDLPEVARALGTDEVLRRVRALAEDNAQEPSA